MSKLPDDYFPDLLADNTPQRWQRWELDPFDSRPGSTEAALPSDDALALIASLSEEAEHKAKKKGHAEGLAAGLEQGKTEGYSQGYEAGFQEGVAKGQSEARTSARQLTARLSSLLENYTHALNSLEAEVGQQLIGLATHIAEHVIRSTLEIHPEKLLALVDEMIDADPESQTLLKIRVNPQDLELIHAHLELQHKQKSWQLIADDTIEAGGCIAENAHGAIDARLETRWQRVIGSLGQTRPWVSQ